jgi:hypothetical protein
VDQFVSGYKRHRIPNPQTLMGRDTGTSGSLDIKLYWMAGLGKVGTVVQHEHRLVTVRKTHPCLGTK